MFENRSVLRLSRLFSTALSAVAALPALRSAEAVPGYDGVWSVVIFTKEGICDTSYRYPIRITNGNLGNAGTATVSISGKVGKNGAVIVNVSTGDKTATGTGRLAATSGGGGSSSSGVVPGGRGRALDIIQQSAVDAVFLDLSMPVMDGLEVLATLRADAAYRSLPVIVLSGQSDPATVRQAIKLGITDYLVKPLRPRLMEARLQSLLAIVAKRQAASGGAAAQAERAADGRDDCADWRSKRSL